ncbi:MAG: hypothetical protein AMXMBFR34_07270 [Myxococcaceae bacterium]
MPGRPADAKSLGKTINTDYSELDNDILLVAPFPGTKDDGPSARENLSFQTDWAVKAGRRCGVVVMISSLTSQDGDARRIYAEGMSPDLFFGAALVVGNPLARAIASFFMGLSRPRIDTKLFDTIDGATAWLRSIRPGPKASAP